MSKKQGVRLTIDGIVQGVGFRPFIWRLANEANLEGQVFNDASGVKIDLACDLNTAKKFALNIRQQKPPLCRIDTIMFDEISLVDIKNFNIISSKGGNISTGCAPDAATCNDCLNELNDPINRRYQYPFINCTNCGPRLSIIRQIPYDRASTTMADFALCGECQKEYNEPADRRFHAQPNACADCGPTCWIETATGERIVSEHPINELANALKQGKIVAIKGIGGVHLACDATNQEAVSQLRQRKNRPDKALALMASDIPMVEQFALVTEHDKKLLSDTAAPVVLLAKIVPTNNAINIAPSVAPDNSRLGFMLPYSPLHHLIMQNLDFPLVMTSGNRSGEPQAITNEDAQRDLSGIADLLLLHNRPIHNRLDDSVVMQTDSVVAIIRRARGYAPTSLGLPPGFVVKAPIVALGGQLKSTICLVKNDRAIVTQHLGDLDDVSTYNQYIHTLDLYRNLYDITASRYVCDRHPEYLSSKYAMTLEEQGNTVTSVQHHHAHIASCLGDNQYPLHENSVLGICLDGTGYGNDNTLWGCEFLYGGYAKMERVASLATIPLIGGAQAIKSPWRTLYGHLRQHYSANEVSSMQDINPYFAKPICKTFEKMLDKQLNTPLTSSAGRLFDAVAAAIGCAPEYISYEGQAAIRLESLASQCKIEVEPYILEINDSRINTGTMWRQLIADLRSNRDQSAMAKAFHLGLANVLCEMTQYLSRANSFSTVVLSGGVMQNQILHLELYNALQLLGLKVLTHQQLPANDGGLSFGQALVFLANLNE